MFCLFSNTAHLIFKKDLHLIQTQTAFLIHSKNISKSNILIHNSYLCWTYYYIFLLSTFVKTECPVNKYQFVIERQMFNYIHIDFDGETF